MPEATDLHGITIIGGGPTGLFAAYYAGFRGLTASSIACQSLAVNSQPPTRRSISTMSLASRRSWRRTSSGTWGRPCRLTKAAPCTTNTNSRMTERAMNRHP